MNKQVVVAVLCIVHILAFTICTYIAAIDIETILVTGWICFATGLVAGISATVARELSLAWAAFLAPIVAFVLVFLEVGVLHLGPNRAALPFCIVFFVTQLATTLGSFRSIRFGSNSKQISLSLMLVTTAAFSVVFSVARFLLQREHNILMLIALSMAGLTFVGIVLTVYNWLTWRNTQQNATT